METRLSCTEKYVIALVDYVVSQGVRITYRLGIFLLSLVSISLENKSKPYDGLLMVFAGVSKVLVFKTRTFDKPSYRFCESDGFLLVFN